MKGTTLVIAFFALFTATAVAGTHRSYDLTLSGVELRPGVTVNLHAAVYVDQSHPCNGNVAFAVHGMNHTAATWERMVASLFDENPAGRKICGVVALDMPGRNGSEIPANLWFGAVSLQDYVTAVLGSLDQLKQMGVRPNTIFAHSLGGLIVQLAQQRLIEQGADLRKAYGIQNVVLLASGPPKQVPCQAIDSGTLVQYVMNFAIIDPTAGTMALPDSVWAWMFFAPDPTSPSYVVPGAPTPAEVSAFHYSAPEPLALVGAFADRPSVDAGIFAMEHGTVLTVVTNQQDVVIRPDESRMLYTYLTGDQSASGVVLVPGSEAVHDTQISNPELLLQSIANSVRLP